MGDGSIPAEGGASPSAASAGRATGFAFLSEKRIQGSMMGSNRFPVDMPRLVDFYMSGKLKLDEMISQRIKLEQVNEGFDEMKKGELARSVIVFD